MRRMIAELNTGYTPDLVVLACAETLRAILAQG
jgi:hypothetical protein